MPSPESSQEQYIKAETEKVLKRWKKNPAYLASSSSFRRKGMEEMGFEDVKAEVIPDEVERNAYEEYEKNFSPTFWEKKAIEHTAKVATAKLKAMKVPKDCLGIALDTMPYRFDKNPEFGKDMNSGSFWQAEAMHKPETLDKAKAEVINSFLLLIRNYLRSLVSIKKMIGGEPPSEDLLYGLKMMNFATTIEVITSTAIKFPDSKDIHTYPSKVRLLPRKIYQLAKLIFKEMEKELKPGQNVEDGYKYISNDLEADDLRHRVLNGRDVEENLAEMATEIFIIMAQEGTEPTKISGGINYGSEAVRNYLNIEEVSLVDDEVEDGVYLGFPRENIEKVINDKAISVAMQNL